MYNTSLIECACVVNSQNLAYVVRRAVLKICTTCRQCRTLSQRTPYNNNISHVLTDHQLSKRTLYNIVWNSTDFQHLWILPENHTTAPWTLNFFINPPPNEGWVRVQDDPYYSLERVLQNQV